MLVLFIAVTATGARAMSPADTKVSIDFVNQSPDKILKEIGRQSGLNIVYKSDDAKKWSKITIKATNQPAMTVIGEVAQKVGEEYSLRNNIVVFGKKQGIVNGVVHGMVVDEQGEPLPGATVTIVGSTSGTSTNIEGEFDLKVDAESPVLQVTYVGMKAATMALTQHSLNNNLRITLESNAAAVMDEVVVTGYQNLKRENATGSYSTISAIDLEKRQTGDLLSNLEGQIPGMVKLPENPYNGTGEDALVIRGYGSFQANTSPLIVVDGLPIESGINTINPYDIENITVLKDAAAASIYGARAANGVIVITTKTAKKERLTVDFNVDLTISEKQNYDIFDYADAAEMIELEKLNFNAMLADEDQSYFKTLTNNYDSGKMSNISKVSRLLLENHRGLLSDNELNSRLDVMARNNYQKEYRDIHDRNRVLQQYNVSLRSLGKVISSSLVANFTSNNMGVQKEYNRSLTLKYRGDIKAAKWLDVALGINIISTRSKNHTNNPYGDYSSFMPYESMYNEDGTLNRMEAGVWLGEPVFQDSKYGLKDHSYNLNDEMSLNFSRRRYTNIRSYIHTNFKLLPGWTVQAQFQYEDVYSKTNTQSDKDSYFMRNLYNMGAYESKTSVLYRIPDGGLLQTNTYDDANYTFRAQTRYERDFGHHKIDVLGGFEYRQNHNTSDSNLYYGYDPQTLTHANLTTDWNYISSPYAGVLGRNYTVYPPGNLNSGMSLGDVLHRFYSIYFTGNYVYDARYVLSASYRVDKCDLFGTDPKFRGRPLWSVGASWNMQNEAFLRDVTFINALKLRVSYGLTGNIDSSVSSYLTARYLSNRYNGDKYAVLSTPPNDQLRWEKTASWNIGTDFAFAGYRINGSLDYYRKSGSDLLNLTDIDISTGWSALTINSGNMINKGVELQLQGRVLVARRRSDVGLNLNFNVAYNDNKVTKVSHEPTSGYANLTATLHEGYPIKSLFSFDYAGFTEKKGQYIMTWRDHEGEIHDSSVSGGEFKIEDAVFSGCYDPKWSGSFMPEITWNGFAVSAMFNFYAGHYMRLGDNDWYGYGSASGYKSLVPRSTLDYWNGNTDIPGNGYRLGKYSSNLSYAYYRNTNIEHADYMKLRNLVLSYNFAPKLCNKIGLNNLRLRFQFNNVWTWARNSQSIDPEAVNPYRGNLMNEAPKSYTMSLFFNL